MDISLLDLIFWWIPIPTYDDHNQLQKIVILKNSEINEKYFYALYRHILDLLVPDFDEPNQWLLNTKLYVYYLYSLIIILQNQCIINEKNLNSTDLIQKLKNTSDSWKDAWTFALKINSDCYERFLIYEMILKSIFNIPYDEKNI